MIGCNVVDPDLGIGGPGDYDLEVTGRALEYLRSVGHEAVEFSHALHFSAATAEALREALADIGLVGWSLHAWAGADPLTGDGAERLGDTLARAVATAERLGVGIIVHHVFGPARAEPPGRVALRAAVEIAALRAAWRPGVRFALENLTGQWQGDYALGLVDQLGPPMAGFCIDTGHAQLHGPDPAGVIRQAGSRLITTHVHDNRGTRDEHMPPGWGTIHWASVTDALREVGYAGCVMLELTDGPPPGRRAHIRRELAFGARVARYLEGRIGLAG
jgi:sugar phosphate isomerase/epimerase